MSMIAQYVHKAIEAATPWLVGTAVGFFLLWSAMLIKEKKPFAKDINRFSSLTPLRKFIVIGVLSYFTLIAGSKERGILPSGLIDDISSTVSRAIETVQLRTLPENVSSNAFKITNFAIDSQSKKTEFGVEWASNLMENVDSRNIDLFMSTNLTENGWFQLGRYLMPSGTNSYDFTVYSNDVALAYRPLYVDSFSRMAFFRFGLDFDSDGDGLTDAYENFVSFTDPSNPDTDGDGLSDAQELAADIGTDPLLYDTDGDGVGDGDEIAASSNPHSADTDGDGLLDVAELGTMTPLTEDNFMWFDMSGGTDMLSRYSTWDSGSEIIPLTSETVVNNVCYTNARICVDGTVYLLCPTNSGSIDYCNYSSNLRNTWWSKTHLTIALCSSDLYARTSDWGSKILYGSVVSEGRTFDVVEYRNIGHWNYYQTNELITCQLILPHDETNVVYVSYLCASNAFRTVNLAAGIQYGWLGSWKTGESYYNLSWPITPEFPNDGLTIKYSIGTATNPTQADTDVDGLSDAEEILTYRTDPLVADMDGDALLDGEEFLAGTDPRNPDSDGDGMPDGWEVLNELDPLADDANADPDSDGLLNIDEYKNATDPHQSDSDEDGLADIIEASMVSYSDDIPWFDMTGAAVMSPVADVNYALYSCEMPFTNRIAALEVSLAVVDVNGLVYFGNAATTNGLYSQDSGQDMSGNRSFPSIAVAPYWTDLKLRTLLGSTISHKKVAHSGQDYFVLQYSRIGTNSGSSNNEVSFQVSIPETSPSNVIYVKYGALVDVRGDSNSYKVSVGAQSHGNFVKLPVSYTVPLMTSVTNDMAIAYHFGCGSSPIDADTDSDDVQDDIELQHGTNPRNSDTDGDGLADAWEIANGLDPLSASGENGAAGDHDGDFLSNAKELEYGTNPTVPDTDGDALCDGMETGCIFVTNAVPWMAFDESEDITETLSSANRRCVNWPTPVVMAMQGETVTNVTISANGLLFFNRAGYVNQGDSTSSENFRYEVDKNALVIAPYLEYTYFRTDIPGHETAVKVGTSTYNGEGYLLIEFDNAFRNTSSWPTNAISFQISVPTNHPTCAYVRYKDLSGQYMTGDYASIGMQTFDSRWLYSYCDDDAGKVWENLCLEFLFGANSNPLVYDTDQDGLSDGQEVSIGTSPAKADTDGDELPDNWEVQNSLDPLSAMGDDGASGDSDGDGVDNYAEYGLGTNPHLADTDNDGLSDGKEAVCVSFADPLPWLEISTMTNVTVEITNGWDEAVRWNLPAPIYVQCETVTNITIDKKGTVLLNRSGYADSELWHSVYDLENYAVDTNCFTVVPYGRSLYFCGIEEPSAIKIGTAEHAGRGYIVVEYDNMHHYEPYSSTNAISFQVAIPTGRVERISVSYANRIGNDTDGRSASVGCQSFGAEDRVSYCRNEQGKIYDGMGLSFVVGYGSNPLLADTDGDGISDGAEVNTYGSSPKATDSDMDGLPDAQEVTLGTSLNNLDTDGDGLLDGWEVANNLNPLSAVGDDGASADIDSDGLTNLQEQSAGSNPRNADTDGDGLSDSAELPLGTNPTLADTDNDGLSDGEEQNIGTNPLLPDTDGDGMNDGWEQQHAGDGFDPTVNNATDNNPDNDLNADPDGDGLTNQQEAEAGTSPTNSDTDGDGLSDGVEVGQGSDPNDRADTIPVKWISVTGDLDQNVPKQVRETVTIPAGTTAFIGVFLQSDEYPDYTSTGSEFNDRAVWDIRADGNTPLSGLTLVNNEDGAWDTAAANNHAAHGYSPVVLKDKAIYKASGGADLSITVNLAAMNISDSIRPTTILVGVFPLKVVQANMPTATGVANTTDAATSYSRAFIPTNGVAYITAEPAAPQLTAQFKDLPQWIDVTWSMTLTTERGDKRFDGIDNRTLPQVTLTGSEAYDITSGLQNEIIGGACAINVRIGDTAPMTYPFSIRAKNPLDAAARAYITANVDAEFQSYAWMIAKHESLATGGRIYNQFNPSENQYKELPNWGPDHGWGIAQIDKGWNGDTTAEVYNWHTNVLSMAKILRDKRLDAVRFLGYYSSAYSNQPNWSDPPSTNINGHVISAEMWSTMTLYNGAFGIPGQTTPTHNSEFFSPLQFVPATGQWLFHHNSRNPNYVRDVFSDSEVQEVE